MGNSLSAGRSVAPDNNASRLRTRNDNTTKVQRLMIAKPVKGRWVTLMAAITKMPGTSEQMGRNSQLTRICLRLAFFALRYSCFNSGELRTAIFTLRRRDFSKLGECNVNGFPLEVAGTFLPAHCPCPGPGCVTYPLCQTRGLRPCGSGISAPKIVRPHRGFVSNTRSSARGWRLHGHGA